jgi:ankyrin repeat protein
MESNENRIRVSRRKPRLNPIPQDPLRRTATGFGNNDNTKAMQNIMEENERLKSELDSARKEIFKLKEENIELKKQARPPTNSTKTTFLTSSNPPVQNSGISEESKIDADHVTCHNCNGSIAKQSYNLHVIYCEKNLTECSYCKVKLNKADIDSHIEEERGTYEDLLEAVIKNKLSDTEIMYEHGNDINALSENDTSKNTLLHISVMHGNKETAEFLIKQGINVNVRNHNNETPLHHAIAIKDDTKATETIEMMMTMNADPFAKDKLGDTPTEKAKR